MQQGMHSPSSAEQNICAFNKTYQYLSCLLLQVLQICLSHSSRYLTGMQLKALWRRCSHQNCAWTWKARESSLHVACHHKSSACSSWLHTPSVRICCLRRQWSCPSTAAQKDDSVLNVLDFQLRVVIINDAYEFWLSLFQHHSNREESLISLTYTHWKTRNTAWLLVQTPGHVSPDATSSHSCSQAFG